MLTIRLLTLSLIILFVSACSSFGKGGSGSSDYGVGEGNIPLASAGEELLDVNFAFDSAALNSSAQSVLKANSSWLQENDDSKIVIEGHCDERGTAEYNLALGERRARSVYDFLRSLGVESSRLSLISYGEELPLDPSSSESAWAKNRRAHFAIK